MARDFEIEDLLQKIREMYGDRVNASAPNIEAWVKGLKFAAAENLEKALQSWVENNAKIPTLSDIRNEVRKFEAPRPGYVDPDEFQRGKAIEAQNYREGLRKIKTGTNATTWIRKEYACRFQEEFRQKIDVILEYFGHDDWMAVLRRELGLTGGITGIHAFMKNKEMLAKYRSLVDSHIALVPGAMAA